MLPLRGAISLDSAGRVQRSFASLSDDKGRPDDANWMPHPWRFHGWVAMLVGSGRFFRCEALLLVSSTKTVRVTNPGRVHGGPPVNCNGWGIRLMRRFVDRPTSAVPASQLDSTQHLRARLIYAAPSGLGLGDPFCGVSRVGCLEGLSPGPRAFYIFVTIRWGGE